jgi:hypothetical protein
MRDLAAEHGTRLVVIVGDADEDACAELTAGGATVLTLVERDGDRAMIETRTCIERAARDALR